MGKITNALKKLKEKQAGEASPPPVPEVSCAQDSARELVKQRALFESMVRFPAGWRNYRTLVFSPLSSNDLPEPPVMRMVKRLTAEVRGLFLIIDADLATGTMAADLGCSSTPGLSNFLKRQAGWDQVCVPLPEHPGVHFVPRGDKVLNPAELLNSFKMHQLLETMGRHYDYIFLNTAPVPRGQDAAVLGAMTDGVVLYHADDEPAEDIARAEERISRANAKVVGYVASSV